MDEALKALAAEQTTEPVIQAGQTVAPAVPQTKEAPVAAQSKLDSIKKWFVLHPKVQAAFIALGLVAALNGQGAYDGTESPREAVHRTVGAVIVAVVAYLKKSNGSPV